jgi:hypothetical protein
MIAPQLARIAASRCVSSPVDIRELSENLVRPVPGTEAGLSHHLLERFCIVTDATANPSSLRDTSQAGAANLMRWVAIWT